LPGGLSFILGALLASASAFGWFDLLALSSVLFATFPLLLARGAVNPYAVTIRHGLYGLIHAIPTKLGDTLQILVHPLSLALADRFRIGGIILLPLDERLYIAWRNEPYLMP
jgi:hypothetical protein